MITVGLVLGAGCVVGVDENGEPGESINDLSSTIDDVATDQQALHQHADHQHADHNELDHRCCWVCCKDVEQE